MKKIYLVLLLALLGCWNGLEAQENADHFEFDLSFSPSTDAFLVPQGHVMTADLAARYRFNDHFSAGIGINPTFLNYSDYGEINYAPLMLSMRYALTGSKGITPYFLLNLGGSLMQLNDYEFQGRFAVGADLSITPRCSLFTEVGITYMIDGVVWCPISLGIRL